MVSYRLEFLPISIFSVVSVYQEVNMEVISRGHKSFQIMLNLWEVSLSVCRSCSVLCQVKDENLKPKIKCMFLRSCRNTKTRERLYCVSSNARQSQYLLYANGSCRCQGSGTLLVCLPYNFTMDICIFEIAFY